MANKKEQIGIVQIELEGKPFNRQIDINPKNTVFLQSRKVRLMAILNQTTGLIEYHSLKDLPSNINPDDFYHFPITEGEAFDLANQGSPTLSTIRKHGSSRPFFDINKLFEKRGGDPSHRTPKTEQGGWFTENPTGE